MKRKIFKKKDLGWILLVVVLLVVLKLAYLIVPKSGADITPPTFPPITTPISNPVFELKKGWNLIAQPGKYYQDPKGPIYTPAAPNFNFYHPHTDVWNWEALKKKYIDLDKNQKITQPGEGFWIYSDKNEKFSLKAPSSFVAIGESEYKITLQPGWNQVGNPFNESIDIQKIKVIIDMCQASKGSEINKCLAMPTEKSYVDARKDVDLSSFYTFDGLAQEWVNFNENSFPFKIGGCSNPNIEICPNLPPPSIRGVMPSKLGAFIYNYKTFPITLTFVSDTTSTITNDWKIFNNSGYRFSFKYPNTYILFSQYSGVSMIDNSKPHKIVIKYSTSTKLPTDVTFLNEKKYAHNSEFIESDGEIFCQLSYPAVCSMYLKHEKLYFTIIDTIYNDDDSKTTDQILSTFEFTD